MQRQFTPAPLSLQVQVMTPAERRLTCVQPLFALPARTRVIDNLSLRMVCGIKTRYLQVSVQMTDLYMVAAPPIASRQTLSEDDIDWRTNRLDLRRCRRCAIAPRSPEALASALSAAASR